MDAFMYINLVSKFFSEGKLITSRPERIKRCIEYVMNEKCYESQNSRDFITKKIKALDVTFMKKWRDSKCRELERFNEENEAWIHLNLQLPPTEESNKRIGRPKISGFDDLSDRSKNRRAAELTECELGKLLLASAQSAKKAGDCDMEYVLKLVYKDREMAKKIRDLLKAEELLAKKPKPSKMEPSRGLTHLLDNRLSKIQYVNTRLLAKEFGSDIFPSYDKVRESKNDCRPPADCLKINDVCASVSLQSLLDHTTSRLLLLQKDVIDALNVDTNEITITLQGKWGGDGSSDQSQFNQKYVDVDSPKNTDGNLFATTVVPLRMTTNDGKIVWNNATPQSPRWCRPIQLQFAKETPELTLEIFGSVRDEIRKLVSYVTIVAGKKITVTYQLYHTMSDGKVHAVVTHTNSMQTCTVCKATPKEFNNLEDMRNRFKPKSGTLIYGVSVLHLWIRCFEFLLHISYRLDVKPFPQWQMRGPVLKEEVKRRKRLLQDRFWKEMNLRVDFPSKKGSGNSNSGPVARKAFSDPSLLATILQVDVDLVKKISTILIALSCQLPLDPDKFSIFCEETALYYVSKYKWFPMPQSVHKILIHARDLLLANDGLPLGVLAEDAAESCNKLYRHNRQFHARNVSRQQNLKDVFNRALDTSDPIISSFALQKRLNSRSRKNIPTEVLRLLKAPDVPASIDDQTLLLEGNNDDESFHNSLNEILDGFGLDELSLPDDADEYEDEVECEDI